ncbi:GlxA family transcriptional regulator [Desulfolithobacter sp.]
MPAQPEQPYRVAILALDNMVATTVTGPADVFSLTGVLWEMIQGKKPIPRFEVRIVSPGGRTVCCYNGITLVPQGTLEDISPDIVIIPGIMEIDQTLKNSTTVLAWLRQQCDRGSMLAAICSGSILLAATGLLDGRRATTHWAMVPEFRNRYPRVNLEPNELITEDGNLYCSGAFNSFLDLSVYLIEKLCGLEVAIQCAKVFLHDLGRHSQSPYTIFLGRHDHGDTTVRNIQQEMEKDYRRDFDLDQLARRHGMGRRTMERHFKHATGETPLVYLQRVRVERAKQMLESTNMSFDEISYQVGYRDTGFFRKLFVKYTSLLPGEYRCRFSREKWPVSSL